MAKKVDIQIPRKGRSRNYIDEPKQRIVAKGAY